MLQTIRDLLVRTISYIDVGNSNISDKECEEIIRVLTSIVDKSERLSKYEAARYLNMGRSTFDKYIREGKLPKGNKQAGFKELYWTKKDLDEAIKKSRK